MKRTNQFLVMICALFLLLLAAPTTASASGLTSDSKWGESGNIYFTVDDSGVLTWSPVAGATSYDLMIWTGNGLFKSETGLTSTSYDLEAQLDQYRKDSGSVQVTVNVWGGSVDGDTAYFLYASPYPKLEAPTNLHWDGTVAEWDDVPNANEYDVYLHQATGGGYTHWSTNGSSFDFASVGAAGNAIEDGWFFRVKAINVTEYRDSEYNESPRKGNAQGAGVIPETQVGGTELNVRADDFGVLTWNAVPGATSYDLTIWTDNGLFKSETGLTSTSYDLEAQLIAYRKDTGTIRVSIAPKGVSGYANTVSFMYSSPYTKLEAPAGLIWNGSVANWNDVLGASGYRVSLYQPSGGAYGSWTTTESHFDFASVASPEEGWFFKVQATATEYVRDSVYNESPLKEAEVSTQIWLIGAYVYNETLDEFDTGGQVYMETTGGTYDWSSSGYTEYVVQGTAVTVKAQPAAGYRFVEWRQGTQGSTISTDAEYTFTCVGPQYLYAVFKEDRTTPITGVSLRGLSSPVVDEYIQYVDGSDLEEDISGAHKYRVIDNQTCSWRDEEGRAINYGAQVFEAGRTYSISFNIAPKDGYEFISEDIPVTLANLYDYEYTGSIELSQETSVAKVTFTFELPGERTYADIVNFRFYGMRAPKDGDTVSVHNGEWAYNNSEVTDRYWTDGAGNRLAFGSKFVGENSYFYHYEFTAFDGYKFAENISVRADNEAPTNWEYTFNNARTTLHIKIPYYINTSDTVSSVVVSGMFVPNQTKSTKAWDSNVYLRTSSDANYQIPLQTKSWYEVDAEYSVDTEYKVTEPVFRAGKQYKMFLILHAKDGYKFAPPETMSFEFSGIPANIYTYTCRSGGADDIIEVVITFTAQFPDDVGENANNPAWCYSYIELKTALESNDIRYVALGNIDETMPVGEEGLVTAIRVNGIKTLNLLGDATFTAPASTVTTYAALLHVTNYNTLNISGAGSLTFRAVASNSYNAVIYNQGGMVNISGGTLIGSYNTAVYGKAIWQEYGELRITGGQFFAENALAPGRLPAPKTAVYINGGQAWIQGGTFRTDNVIDTIDLPYGLDIGQYATVDLSGGTYYGILLPTDSTPLANYMDEEIYTPLSDESTFNPASEYSQKYVESGKVVRIAWMIDHVDVYVNAPKAGVYINENYFEIPTSGCEATMYYPQWYKNGELVTYGTFEAGANYKVVVQIDAKADYNAEFGSGITAAINFKPVNVERKSSQWIEVEYDFGECLDITEVTDVGVEIDAPRKGSTPDQLINNMTTPGYAKSIKYGIQWQESSDGSSWTEMGQNDTFEVGKYYRVFINLKAASGYEFATDSSWEPEVSATVNGNYAEVFRYPEESPDEIIFLRYSFGILNDVYIPEIRVNDIVEPKVGQKPSYTCTIGGNGYTINTAYSGGATINGIFWYDLTDDVAMTGNRTFTLGNEYKVVIDVKTEDGFEFSTEQVGGSYRPTGSGYINGNPATFGIQSDGRFEQNVQYIFTCGKQEITTIMLYNLDTPVGGNVPDTDVTAAYPEYYTVKSVTWTDIEGGAVGATFETGVPYQATIVVQAKPEVYFSDPAVYIDGSQPNSNNVTVNDAKDTVTIVYTFSKPAQAPEIEYYFFLDQPSGGEVFAGEALNISWSTTFIPSMTEIQYWDGEMWDQWDVQYPENKQDDYDFENVDAGSIQFRIVAYVGNEPRATSNEFTVTWKDPVSAVWSGDSCTVKLDLAESGVTVIAVSYRNGKMVKLEYLTKSDHTAVLTGDQVKIFYLYETTNLPVRKAAEPKP